jgi:uncharacterized protein YceK
MKVAAFGLLSLCLGGCGSFYSAGVAGSRIYGGVRVDAQAVYEKPYFILVVPLDLPFSITVDTLLLPIAIVNAIEHGEQSVGTLFPPEPREAGIIEGIVAEAEDSGYDVLPIGKWPPQDLHPLPGTRVRAFAANEVSVVDRTTDENGRYLLSGDWETPWKTILIEKEGYNPVRIPVFHVHSPAERGYWAQHRLLVRIAKKS